MKKINNILTNYFSVNLLSILGNLSLLILLFYIFIVYPLATSNLPNDVDSFDVLYGIVMELCEIFECVFHIYCVLIVFILIEFVIQRLVKYKVFKVFQNKLYVVFFHFGLFISIIFIICGFLKAEFM